MSSFNGVDLAARLRASKDWEVNLECRYPDMLALFFHTLCRVKQQHHRSTHCKGHFLPTVHSILSTRSADRSSRRFPVVCIRAITCNQRRAGYHNKPPTPSATMAQPLPFGMEETEGWWATPEPFITLPFVVGSVCGHTLSGATVPGKANSIPAAENTHCSECTAVEVTRPEQSPIAGIATVVGIVCHHALGGVNTPIGPTTIPAAVTRLCATCTSFNKIAQELSTRYKQWQDPVRAYNWTYFAVALDLRTPDFRHPREEDIVTNPRLRDYVFGRKLLARHYERLRLKYELNACRLQGFVDPALPIVDLDGVALLPVHGSEPSATPYAKQAPLRRVTFDEDQQHPSRETARRRMQFKRKQRGPRSEANAYRPGKYADLTGRGWENTSSPVFYQSDDDSSADDMSVNPFCFAETSSLGDSAASWDSASNAEDTSARGLEVSQEGKISTFLAPLIIYTPSSPLSQRQKVQEDQGEESSVSEE